MATGVWDGIDKQRISRGVTTAFGSDEYLEVLAMAHNAESPREIVAAKERIKELMALWREEVPEYSFMIDCLFLYADQVLRDLTGSQD